MPARIEARAFTARDPGAPIVELTGETMGTCWRTLHVDGHGASATQVRVAIEQRLASLVAEMSHWEPDSLLSRFNRAPAGAWMSLPPDFAHVMAQALRFADLTDGLVDPAIGRLVDLWGHGPPGPAPVPDAAAIRHALDRSGWQRLEWDAAGRRLRQPGGLALDLSAIAKGHAVDALADVLHGLGIQDCLVDIGGELVGRGLRPDGDPWWVDLEQASDDDRPPLRIALHGLAVATSGNYRRGDHTIDPRTGVPVGAGMVSVSVIAATALDADAWATALTVAGSQGAVALADRHGIAARVLARQDGIAREQLSRSLQAMLVD